ncbi:TPA: hypothetical protein ACG0M5_003365 [Enterobacter hormaechei subsp. steigerwaltii]
MINKTVINIDRISIFSVQTEEQYLQNKDLIDINEIEPIYGNNALWGADEDKTSWLIKHGININHTNGDDFNVLFVTGNTISKIKILVEHGIDINHVDRDGFNALFHFNHYPELEITKHLLKIGIDTDMYKGPTAEEELFQHMPVRFVNLIKEQIAIDTSKCEKEILSNVLNTKEIKLTKRERL